MNRLQKIFQNTEFKLVLFLGYILSLFYVGITRHQFLPILFCHLIFVILFSIFYFGGQFLLLFFAPLIAVSQLIDNCFSKRYLKNFEQDVPAEVVVVLGQSNWFKLESWLKNNYCKSELKSFVRTMKAERKDFSFYLNANLKDVEKIMSNNDIKEVYFWGHGSSHTFQLNTDEILYYCDFNDPKYGKRYAHQVHCGTPHGKSLIDYVVPEKNRARCFLFRKPINSPFIQKEFKRREKLALSEKQSQE